MFHHDEREKERESWPCNFTDVDGEDCGWGLEPVDFTAIPLVTARRGSVLSSWPVLTVSHL